MVSKVHILQAVRLSLIHIYIYSHTKSFTVTAVGLAIEEGKLSLEDNVAEVFKDTLPSNPEMCIRDRSLSYSSLSDTP